ncbi:MAG: twin-arginine translocase TatA/TatE family subunit [Acidobacteria bacterium]|nr:twin-arginine translocase TatA/TatE family subunit [Acidobacteriaceae bacterium]MBV9608940.1 twin-arginine translocase TatA/TatE family subunit [Acidobacteriota bacterium]
MDLGIGELLFIFILALLLFGPKKLPEIGRQIGKFMNEFRRASNDFRSQIEDEIRQIEVTEAEKRIAPPPPERTVSSSATPAAMAADHPPDTPDKHPTASAGVEGG